MTSYYESPFCPSPTSVVLLDVKEKQIKLSSLLGKKTPNMSFQRMELNLTEFLLAKMSRLGGKVL